MSTTKMQTPREIATEFGVNVSKVIAWISSGELRAIDVSAKRGGPRGRWRIERAAVEAFIAGRENQPRPAVTRRRRRAVVQDEF